MTRRALLALLALLAAGCLGGKIPAVELYRLTPQAPPDGAAASGPRLQGSIAIVRYDTPGVYGGQGIVYRVEESEYGVYPTREWAIPLGEMLATLTEDILRAEPLTAEPAVFNPPSRRTYTYLWRGSVGQFEEVVRDKKVYAAVQLQARLVRLEDNAVVWSAERRAEREVPEGTMPAIVSALSSLSAEVLASLVQDARLAAPRLASDTATARP
jgi:ABC-type uncharacterized transport system auxiliary subunit